MNIDELNERCKKLGIQITNKGWINVWRFEEEERPGWGIWDTALEAKRKADEWLRDHPPYRAAYVATIPSEEWC